MSFSRPLRRPVTQFFDHSRCHQAIFPHDRISFTFNLRSYEPNRKSRYRHDRGQYTRKAQFSTASVRLLASSREPTLYEVLDVPVTATPAEIKKCVLPLLSSSYHCLNHTKRECEYYTDMYIIQKVLRPLPRPPPRPQPQRPRRLLALRQNLFRLPNPQQQRKALNV